MNQEERDFVVEEPEESFETKSGKKKRKKKQNGFGKGFFAGVIVMALLSVVIFGVYEYVSGVSVSRTGLLDRTTSKKLKTLAAYIQSNYYEDVDTGTLQEGLYAGLFDNLDVYSQYYTAEHNSCMIPMYPVLIAEAEQVCSRMQTQRLLRSCMCMMVHRRRRVDYRKAM